MNKIKTHVLHNVFAYPGLNHSIQLSLLADMKHLHLNKGIAF